MLFYILIACLFAMLGAALAGYLRVQRHRNSKPIIKLAPDPEKETMKDEKTE
ncbi:MAG: hypothetical protein ABI383_01110 [Acidobacteriaceae bacterium]